MLVPSSAAPLEAINELASHVDAYLAARLLSPPDSPDHLQAVVMVSADVEGVNRVSPLARVFHETLEFFYS